MTDDKQYPELPVIEHWLNNTYTASQMRQYVDEDRATRAALTTPTRDQIRSTLLAHGFTIKEGQSDLKEYVYEAAEALLSLQLATQKLATQPKEPAPSQEAEDIYWKLHSISKCLESSGVLYEDQVDGAYGAILDAMHLVRRQSQDAEDAARYRWLRTQHWSESYLCVVANPKQAVKLGHDCPIHRRLDTAIDAARKQEGDAT